MLAYEHLSLGERFAIAWLHAAGRSKRAIARFLGRAPSTIGREFARNSNADDTDTPRRPSDAIWGGDGTACCSTACRSWRPSWSSGSMRTGRPSWLKSGVERLQVLSHEAIYA